MTASKSEAASRASASLAEQAETTSNPSVARMRVRASTRGEYEPRWRMESATEQLPDTRLPVPQRRVCRAADLLRSISWYETALGSIQAYGRDRTSILTFYADGCAILAESCSRTRKDSRWRYLRCRATARSA